MAGRGNQEITNTQARASLARDKKLGVRITKLQKEVRARIAKLQNELRDVKATLRHVLKAVR